MPSAPAPRPARRDPAALEPVVFAGEFRHSMDPKHRVTVPARWRRGDGADEFFLLPSQGNDHLLGFPPTEFEKVSRLVNENPAIPPRDRQIFIRQFYSKAQHCPMDKQGRLLVPDDLRRLAALEDELLLVGAYSRFEIWNPQRWSRVKENEEVTYQHVANLVGL